MSSQIKLYYYNYPAYGEVIRYILSYGDLKFEDIRYATMKDFDEHRDKFPYHSVPVLEIDGKTLHQTRAICRYLAKKVGLTGKTEWDSVECDMIVDTIKDFRDALASFKNETNEEKKAEKRLQVLGTQVPFYLGKFEEQLANNGGHFVNGQVTWADFFFCSMVEYFEYLGGTNLLAARTNLIALIEKINNLPKIKEYLANRPPLPSAEETAANEKYMRENK